MPNFRTKPFAVILSIVALSSPLSAQEDLSIDELMSLFERQREVFQEAETNGMGATRGLKLVTVDESAANTTEAVNVSTETGSETSSQDGTQTGAQVVQAASDPKAPLVFGQLDPELQVNLQIKFGFDSAALSSDEAPKLEKMCQVLQRSSINLVRIVGHTDTSGTEEYNERLSILRAKEVARHLVDNCGIDPARLETQGMGERFPFNADDTRADENRRVEFQALS
ncbi:OmpA family protein [Shimia sagamensis]|uniref:OmpA family protein n=1 Tax=Shimia sagamensis TaxID=1566352 RepID=A0ABY1PI17_9RHOB|nr:OmpA family protein [Shimia sagamensis]SMP34720.1 OmpA family protein [Shimia sagamensis]